MWDSFWDFLGPRSWSLHSSYLIILWHIIVDLFRDRNTSGLEEGHLDGASSSFSPTSSIIYPVARGRNEQAADRGRQEAKSASDDYIRPSRDRARPADRISQGIARLGSDLPRTNSGTLKAKALAS